MEINKVMGERVFLTDMEPYKAPNLGNLEIIQYTGVIKKAKVAHIGADCKHTAVGEEVIYQEPVGIEMNFEGIKYLVLREADIMFTLS